jgi:hypothetical protein
MAAPARRRVRSLILWVFLEKLFRTVSSPRASMPAAKEPDLVVALPQSRIPTLGACEAEQLVLLFPNPLPAHTEIAA